MSGFVLFGGMLAVLLVVIVWAALRSGADTGVALDPVERRDAAVEALRDLELEYRTGKLTDDEYASVRARLERTALQARDEAAEAGCPGCGASLSGDEAFCPVCGEALPPPSS